MPYITTRKTEKILVWEDKYNKRIYLNHNRGWFKNFLNNSVQTELNISLGITILVLGIITTICPFVVEAAQQAKAKRVIDSYYPGLSQNMVSENETSNLYFLTALGIMMIIIAILYFCIPVLFKNLDPEYTVLKYRYQPKEIFKYFKHIPDKVLEEYLIVDKKLSEAERRIKEIEGMFKSDEPLDQFLKIELSKQLRSLKDERTELRIKREKIFQQSVYAMEFHLKADLEKLNKAKEEENNEKALRMLDDLNKKKAS